MVDDRGNWGDMWPPAGEAPAQPTADWFVSDEPAADINRMSLEEWTAYVDRLLGEDA